MMENEEMNSKISDLEKTDYIPDGGIRLLEQVLCTWPNWDSSSTKLLLKDFFILGKEIPSASSSRRLSRIKESLIIPLAKILLKERDNREADKLKFTEKEERLLEAICGLKHERDAALDRLVEEADTITQQNMFLETLLGDLDEMARKVEHDRQTVKHLQQALEETQERVHELEFEKQQLVKRIANDGPTAFVEWAQREMGISFENSPWLECLEKTNHHATPSVSASSVASNASTITSSTKHQYDQVIFNRPKVLENKIDLLEELLKDIIHEVFVSLKQIEEIGLIALPSALLHFWMGLAGRLADCLAEATLLKVHKSPLACFFQLF